MFMAANFPPSYTYNTLIEFPQGKIFLCLATFPTIVIEILWSCPIRLAFYKLLWDIGNDLMDPHFTASHFVAHLLNGCEKKILASSQKE